jgi:cysteinyl-tRNA synthetase
MKLHRDDISVSKEREETLASENKNDNTSAYVLLKKSESHEHFWQSPWGPGRPGTEILYSFMGNIVLGEN